VCIELLAVVVATSGATGYQVISELSDLRVQMIDLYRTGRIKDASDLEQGITDYLAESNVVKLLGTIARSERFGSNAAPWVSSGWRSITGDSQQDAVLRDPSRNPMAEPYLRAAGVPEAVLVNRREYWKDPKTGGVLWQAYMAADRAVQQARKRVVEVGDSGGTAAKMVSDDLDRAVKGARVFKEAVPLFAGVLARLKSDGVSPDDATQTKALNLAKVGAAIGGTSRGGDSVEYLMTLSQSDADKAIVLGDRFAEQGGAAAVSYLRALAAKKEEGARGAFEAAKFVDAFPIFAEVYGVLLLAGVIDSDWGVASSMATQAVDVIADGPLTPKAIEWGSAVAVLRRVAPILREPATAPEQRAKAKADAQAALGVLMGRK